MKFSNGLEEEYPVGLQLGELRDVKNRKKRYAASVHEAGHAVVQAMTTGYAPTSIVSVSTDRGGFCGTYIKDKEGEIQSKYELESEIMVGLAGYYAEKIIFGEDRPEMILLGSSSDIEETWEIFSNACYREGYIFPYSFDSRDTDSNTPIPHGFDSNIKLWNSEDGESIETMEQIAWNKFSFLIKKTVSILREERELIKQLALYLGKNGYMTENIFLDFVDKHGETLTRKSMEETREMYGPNFYLKKLME